MVIGVTGGVGCGKSTVLKMLKEQFGVFIIDADKVAHRLMEPGKESYNLIREFFGESIIGDDEKIDRKELGKIVFGDKNKLSKLNSFVHPQVKADILAQISDIQSKTSSALVAVEAAIFIEAGYMDICDELWYIYTENEIRISRLMKDRGYTREKAESIINSQLSDDEFRKYCTRIIDNSHSEENTMMQLESILD